MEKDDRTALRGRFDGLADLGYVRTPDDEVDRIAALIEPLGTGSLRVADPCCGEGLALVRLRESIERQGVRVETFAGEIDRQRADRAEHILGECLWAPYQEAQWKDEVVDILHLNPPYSQGRLELQFLRELQDVLCIGGLLFYVIRQRYLRGAIAARLATHFEELAVYPFLPHNYERYGQVVVVGRKRVKGMDREVKAHLSTIGEGQMFASDLWGYPEAPFAVECSNRHPFYLRRKQVRPEELAADARQFGIRTSRWWQERIVDVPSYEGRTLLPLRDAQIASLMLLGFVDNHIFDFDGQRYLFRGHHYVREEDVTTREDLLKERMVTVERSIQGGRLLSLETGRIRELGPQGVLHLIQAHPETFAGAVTDHVPALRSQLTLEDREEQILRQVYRFKRLPGRAEPGLTFVQKVAAAVAAQAIHERLTKVVVLNSDTGTGKCVSGDTLVPSERGMLPIVDLDLSNGRKSQTSVNLVVQTKDGPRVSTAFHNSGVHPVLEIETVQGFRLVATHDHPLWVMDEGAECRWKELAEFKPGDYVAIQRHGAVFGNRVDLPPFDFRFRRALSTTMVVPRFPQVLDEETAYVLGVLVADGCMRHETTVDFTTGEPEILEAVSRWCKRIGVRLRKDGPYDYRISSVMLRAWMINLGIRDVLAHKKEIPGVILGAPWEMVRAFLQGLFDGDGWADNRGCVGYCSASETLARQVHVLLLQFGIVGKLRRKATSRRDAWIVDLYGDQARLFFSAVGFRVSRKQERCALLPDKSNPNVDVIPFLPTPCPPVLVRQKYPYRNYWNDTAKRPSYAQVKRMAELYPPLAELLEPPLFWDRVASVKPAGRRVVYDLTVPDGHSFVANGFVSHNTGMAYGAALCLRDHYLERRDYLWFADPSLRGGHRRRRMAMRGSGGASRAWMRTYQHPKPFCIAFAAEPHSLGKMAREARDCLPQAFVHVANTVADVESFVEQTRGMDFRATAVLIVPKSMGKLGSGWTWAANEGLYGMDGRLDPRRPYHCPHCGQVITYVEEDGDGNDCALPVYDQNVEDTIGRVPTKCGVCGKALYQFCRRDFKTGRPLIPGLPEGFFGQDYEPGQVAAPRVRYPVAEYVYRRWRDFFDVVIWDEAHDANGDPGNDIVAAYRYLTSAARLGWLEATASNMNGYASNVFTRGFHSSSEIRRRFRYDEREEFVSTYGLYRRITRLVEEEAGVYSGRLRKKVQTVEYPGVQPTLSLLMLPYTVVLLMEDLGAPLPPRLEVCDEFVTGPDQLTGPFARVVEAYRELSSFDTDRTPRAWPSKQQACLAYLNAPWNTERITMLKYDDEGRLVRDEDGNPVEQVLRTADPTWDIHDPEMLPKEKWLIETIDRALGADVGVSVMLAHVERGIQERLAWLVSTHLGYDGVRYCTANARRRQRWYEQCVRDGVKVILSHPGKLKTSLDLLAHPWIIFYQPLPDAIAVIQSKGRAWRLGQSLRCETRFLYYAQTEEHAMLVPLADKIIAHNLLRGGALAGGLMDMGHRLESAELTRKALRRGRLPHLGTLLEQGAIGEWLPPDQVAERDRQRREQRRAELATDILDLSKVMQPELF
jgi:intein/homing endonuclease